MTVRDIVQQLRDMGYEVSFFVRKDGGLRITKIGEQRFTGSKGNIAGRTILGVQLSERRASQLESIRTQKGSFGHYKLQKLPKDLERELRKAQRLFRKRGVEFGKPITKNIRYTLKHEGEAQAYARLKKSMQYARGEAYEENIDYLIERLEKDKNDVKSTAHEKQVLQEVIDYVKSYRSKNIIMEWQLGQIFDNDGALYRWETNRGSVDEVKTQIISILSSK